MCEIMRRWSCPDLVLGFGDSVEFAADWTGSDADEAPRPGVGS